MATENIITRSDAVSWTNGMFSLVTLLVQQQLRSYYAENKNWLYKVSVSSTSGVSCLMGVNHTFLPRLYRFLLVYNLNYGCQFNTSAGLSLLQITQRNNFFYKSFVYCNFFTVY